MVPHRYSFSTSDTGFELPAARRSRQAHGSPPTPNNKEVGFCGRCGRRPRGRGRADVRGRPADVRADGVRKTATTLHGTWQCGCGSDWAPHPLERAAGRATLTACANARAIAVDPRPLGVPRSFIRRNANTDSRRAGVRWRGECILSRHSKFKFTAVDWVPTTVTGHVKGSPTKAIVCLLAKLPAPTSDNL